MKKLRQQSEKTPLAWYISTRSSGKNGKDCDHGMTAYRHRQHHDLRLDSASDRPAINSIFPVAKFQAGMAKMAMAISGSHEAACFTPSETINFMAPTVIDPSASTQPHSAFRRKPNRQ